MNQLTVTETSRLSALEKIIKSGEKTFIQVGDALTEIRDKKLYRAEHGTFEKYCERVWGWTRKNAYQLIAAAPVAKCNPEVTNVKAAVALSKVPPPKRAEVLKKIEGKVTAPAIKRASQPPQKPTRTILLDGTGIEVPQHALTTWNRMAEVQQLLTILSAVRGALRKAQADKDILFAEVDFTDDLAKLNQVYVDLQTAKPFAVCPECNGKLLSKSCKCHGRGFISEFYWKNKIPEQVRKLRE
jgi:hypothetical protein